jgi:hypothetical protein
MDIPELDAPFVFRRRPVALPEDLRPAWRIGLILLLLKVCCRSGRSTLARLHALSWAIRADSSRHALLGLITGSHKYTARNVIVRFDPALNRAVDLALGERLVRRCAGRRIELLPKGDLLATALNSSENAYQTEKEFMRQVRQRFTEELVNQLFSGSN